MKSTFRIVVLLFVLVSAVCQAEIIKIGFTGLVDSVDDTYNLLEDGIGNGDLISGFYIYDSQTQDSTPHISYSGLYQHTASLYGMSMTIDDLTFQTDTTDVDFVVWMRNNFEGTVKDRYRISSDNNLPLKDLNVSRLDWILGDYSGDAISSKELPDTIPDLSAWQRNLLIVSGSDGDGYFRMFGHVTEVWLIPEPATILLFGLGGLLLRRRK